MNSNRNGKIARLPRAVRDELNRRLLDGEMGTGLLRWLNDLPEVRAVLAAGFGGRSINGPNLTAWRQQGFREWLLEQEVREMVVALGQGAAPGVTETLVHAVVVRCVQAVSRLEAVDDGTERRALLCRMAGYLAQLRRADQRARGTKSAAPSAGQSKLPAAN